MSAIPPSVFADALQTLSRDEFVSFVGDLWKTAGWNVRTEAMVLVVEKGERRERLLVVPALFLAKFRSATPVDGDVDSIVTPLRVSGQGDLPRGTPAVPVVDAEDLRHRLLYGMDTEHGEQLCTEHLGVTLRGPRWADESGGLLAEMTDRLPDSQSEENAPVSRRTTLSLLGFGAVGGIVYGARELLMDGSPGPTSFDDDPPPTPENVGAPDTRFTFEFENGALSIIHNGGDPVVAGNLYVRGDGLIDSAELQWSDTQQYTVDSELQAGDSLQIPLDVNGELELVWDDGTKETTLATYSGPEPGSTDTTESLAAPDVTFEFSFNNGLLTIRHAGGDTFRADRFVVRASGFEETDTTGEKVLSVTFEQAMVSPGSTVTVAVDPAAILEFYWDHEETNNSVKIGHYTGPERPLDSELSGPSTFSIDSANTGAMPKTPGPTSEVTERFTFETSRPVGSSPAVVDGRLYIANLAGDVYALDAVDGTELWRFETADVIWNGSPTVVDSVVYIGSTDGNLYALDAESGLKQWQFTRLRRVLSSPTYAMVDGNPMLFVSGEGPGPGGMLFGVDAISGTERWRFELGGEPSSAPAVVERTLYVGGIDGSAYALDALSGTEQWSVQESEQRGEANGGIHAMDVPPTVHDDTVFIGSTSGYLYALDTETGERRWAQETGGGIDSSPAFVETVPATDDALGPTVYIGSGDDNVYAFDATDGSERWSFETDGLIVSSPTVAGTGISPDKATVYVGSFDSAVYALDAAEGTQRWAYETGNQILSTPAIADNTVYFGSGDGTIYALEEKN